MPQIYNSHVLLQPVSLPQVHAAIRDAVGALHFSSLATCKSNTKYLVNAVDDDGFAQAVFKIHVLPHVSLPSAVWLNFVPVRTSYSQSRACGRTAFCEAYAHILEHAAIHPFLVKDAVHDDYQPRYTSELMMDAAFAKRAACFMKPLPPPFEDDATLPVVPVIDAARGVCGDLFPLLFTADRGYALKKLLELEPQVAEQASVAKVVSSFMYFYVNYARPSLAELFAAWRVCGEEWLWHALRHAATTLCPACVARGWSVVTNEQQQQASDVTTEMAAVSFPCLVCCAASTS